MYPVGELSRSGIHAEVIAEAAECHLSSLTVGPHRVAGYNWRSKGWLDCNMNGVWRGSVVRDQGWEQLTLDGSHTVLTGRGSCCYEFGTINCMESGWAGDALEGLCNLPRFESRPSCMVNWNVVERSWIWTVSKVCGTYAAGSNLRARLCFTTDWGVWE